MDTSPKKLCECGCGLPAPLWKRSQPSLGRIKGQPARFINGHHGKRNLVDGKLLCGRCGEAKPPEAFYRNYRSSPARAGFCKPCHRRASQRSALKRRYGITASEYDALFEQQQGRCSICGEPSARTLDVDHCHERGHVRGLLCRKCNVILGQAGDDPAILRRAADYLER